MNASLQKGLDLLEHFLGHRERLSLAEISRISGVPKATAYRLLEPFVLYGFLVKDEGGYSLGLRFLEFAARVDQRLVLRRVALPIMERLRNEVDEAVQLAVLEGDEAVYIEKVDSHRPIRLYTQVGRRAPLHAAACPRVLLAYGPPEVRERVLAASHSWQAYTPTTVTDPARVLELLAQIRRTGWSVSRGELAEGSVAVAVPIMGAGNRAMAALSVAGPADRIPDERFPELVELLTRSAADIEKAAGYLRHE
ncbi:MAG: IclR family transcriptional regulator [Bacillota bacterium]